MDFHETVLLHALQRKRSIEGSNLIEAVLEDEAPQHLVRQMCAKVSINLHDQLDSVCSVLAMSKREFIEAAVSDALTRAEEVIQKSGVYDAIEAASGGVK